MSNNSNCIFCCCCGKQVVFGQNPSRDDALIAPAERGRANFGLTVFCSYCAEDLDGDGLFPEERALINDL